MRRLYDTFKGCEMSLAGIPVFREANVETNSTKKSRQKGLRYLPLRPRFKGKYTFLISYIENLSLELKSCQLST